MSTPRTDAAREQYKSWCEYQKQYGHIPEAMEQAPPEADPFYIAEQLEQALALRGEPVASSACPMDGIDMPHGHTVEAVAAYLRLERDRFLLPEHRDAIAVEVRGCPDGWVLLPLKMTAEMIRAVDETLLRSGEGNEEHVQRHFNSLVRAAPHCRQPLRNS